MTQALELPRTLWRRVRRVCADLGALSHYLPRRVRAPTIKQLVAFNSPEYACFYEAGHAVAAHSVGATVVEMELYRESQRSHGRTRADRTNSQASSIALGGFAAEYLLYKSGRLVKQDGEVPSEEEFTDYAYRNANDDFDQFWKYSSGSCDPGELRICQNEMDEKFIGYAVDFAKNSMPFDVVERVASALVAAGTLDQEEVYSAIVQQQSPNRPVSRSPKPIDG